MIPNKLAIKKSKKKRNSDDQNSSNQYQQKRTGKLRKGSKAAKKQIQHKKKSQKSRDKYGLGMSSQSDESRQQSPKNKNTNYIPLQIFNADKVFTEILNKASKNPDFLIMLKNLLSGCSRNLSDKKNMFKKKWKQLRNSNCNQDEYLNRQAELKRAQFEQIHEMQKDIMTKLSYANVKGFQTRNSLIQNYKKEKEVIPRPQEQNGIEVEYEIEDQIWQKYYQEQRRLLQLLMKENDFVSQDYTPSNLIKTYSEPIKDKQQNMKDQVFEDNELGEKFNNIQTQENPESTQFLFSKHFKDVDYDEVFINGANSFKIQENEKFYIEPKAMSWLLQTKSDEIYTNQRFQKQTYRKYSQLLKNIYENPQKYNDNEVISYLLETGAYILNSVHYYQKFKLKCDLLHPLDLQLVIQKVKKQRRKTNSKFEMVDQKQERNSVQNRDVIEIMMEEMKYNLKEQLK